MGSRVGGLRIRRIGLGRGGLKSAQTHFERGEKATETDGAARTANLEIKRVPRSQISVAVCVSALKSRLDNC